MSTSHLIFWSLSIVLLVSAALSAWVRDLRIAVLALWIAALACGGIFLERGAEFLGICFWIMSTISAVIGYFYVLFLGEYGVKTSRLRGRLAGAFILSISWVLVLIYAVHESLWENGWTHLNSLERASQQGTTALGQLIVEENLLAFEVLILTVFVAIIGASVIVGSRQKQITHGETLQ